MKEEPHYHVLPWNFEAFRRFLAYDIVQQTAATLCLFDRQPLFSDSTLMQEFSEMLHIRTGLEWLPRRQASEGVLYNTEGNVFRNKARVFSSLYLIDPVAFKQSVLEVTEFGKVLGCGFINERNFYREICARYEYPHPAYDDNWIAWQSKGLSLKPLAFLLKILVDIYKIDSKGEVTISELGAYAHTRPFYNQTTEIAQAIISGREKKGKPRHQRSDQVDRKIGDMLGFLCMGKLCFYKEDKACLNLLDVHNQEKTAFWHKRLQQNTLAELEDFLESLEESS